MVDHSIRLLIDRAIALAGSQEKLGELVGVSQNAIYSARKAGRVSGELALAIDRATRGKVRKSQLRPDLFGRRLNTHTAQHSNT